LVKKRVYAQWAIPGTLRGQEQIDIVTIKIRILNTGTVSEMEFVSDTDNVLLKKSIIDAIDNSKPFPPFPSDLHEESLDIIINFDTQQ
jgi:outer membrane biosynthesis protein TonB